MPSSAGSAPSCPPSARLLYCRAVPPPSGVGGEKCLQSQVLSVTRARCGPGGYIQVGMRGCVLIGAPHLRHCWWKIESLLLSGLPPSGGRGLLPALRSTGVHVSRSMPVCMCCSACLAGAAVQGTVDLASPVARVAQWPGDLLSVVVYLGGTRGEGPKPGSSWGLS